jgi:hypothetical protein
LVAFGFVADSSAVATNRGCAANEHQQSERDEAAVARTEEHPERSGDDHEPAHDYPHPRPRTHRVSDTKHQVRENTHALESVAFGYKQKRSCEDREAAHSNPGYAARIKTGRAAPGLQGSIPSPRRGWNGLEFVAAPSSSATEVKGSSGWTL